MHFSYSFINTSTRNVLAQCIHGYKISDPLKSFSFIPNIYPDTLIKICNINNIIMIMIK